MTVASTSLYWYQVVASDGKQVGPDLRARVRADNPDTALRMVMRAGRMRFAAQASIYRLGSHGAPSRRQNVRVRLPRVEGVTR